MPDTATTPTSQSHRFWRKLVLDLAVMAGIGVVLAVIGPFGTFETGLPVRLAYWTSLAVAGYAFYRPIGWLIEHHGRKIDLPTWLLWTGACLIATVPMSLVVAAVDRLPYGQPFPPFEVLAVNYGYVLVIGAIVTLLFFLFDSDRAAAAQAKALRLPELVSVSVPAPVSEPAPAVGRFLERLPPHLGTDLIALEMEDHYVRAHTVLGSELILMRLRDAIAELDGIEGLQVHRSWWVARHAVEDVRRDGRNLRLVLPGALEAPVARANVAVLKEQGWI